MRAVKQVIFQVGRFGSLSYDQVDPRVQTRSVIASDNGIHQTAIR